MPFVLVAVVGRQNGPFQFYVAVPAKVLRQVRQWFGSYGYRPMTDDPQLVLSLPGAFRLPRRKPITS